MSVLTGIADDTRKPHINPHLSDPVIAEDAQVLSHAPAVDQHFVPADFDWEHPVYATTSDDSKTCGPLRTHSEWIGLRQVAHTVRCEYDDFKVFPLKP